MKGSLEIYINLSCLWQDKRLLNLAVGSFLLIFPSYLPPILMGYMGIPLRWLLQLCAICRSQFHIPNYPSCSETPLRQTPRCLCESSFWHCCRGRGMGKGTTEMEKTSAEESSRQRAGWEWQSRPGHKARGKKRAGLCQGEDCGAQRSDWRAWLSRREQDSVTCEGRAPGMGRVRHQFGEHLWPYTGLCQIHPDNPGLSLSQGAYL